MSYLKDTDKKGKKQATSADKTAKIADLKQTRKKIPNSDGMQEDSGGAPLNSEATRLFSGTASV